jgi:integral membrane sensor domain MASE1/DNA-binding CsgD family transcriptional regulator
MTALLQSVAESGRSSSLWRMAPSTYWIAIPAVAVIYASVAAVCLALAIPPGYASAVWPPAGIALAAWLAFGPRIWPGIFLGAAIANLGVIGTPLLVALAIGAGNTLEAATAGLLLQRLVASGHRFAAPADVWKFAAVAFATAMIAATAGPGTLVAAGVVPPEQFARHWLSWWLGDATGMVIVTPLLLAWSAPDAPGVRRTRSAEYRLFAAMLGVFAVLAWVVDFPKIAYLTIPLVAWAAGRLDQRAVTGASFVISAVAVVDMLDGTASMFALVPMHESLLLLQLFMSAVALTGLTLAAYAGELQRANASLREAQAELERRAAPAAVAAPTPAAAPESAPRTPGSLTATEREIVRLVAGGKSNVEAARALGLSPRTVETYRGRLMEKLQVDNLPDLVKYAIRNGLTSVD